MRPLGSVAFLVGVIWLVIPAPAQGQDAEVTVERDWAAVVAKELEAAQIAEEDARSETAEQHYTAAYRASIIAQQEPAERAWILRSHAQLLWSDGENERAKPLYQQALGILQEDPELRIERADVTIALAQIAFEMDEPAEGESLFGKGIEVYSEQLGRSAADTVARRLWLARSIGYNDQTERARELATRIESDCEEDFGQTEQLAECYSQIGRTSVAWGDKEAAVEWYHKALAVREVTTQPDSPERVDAVLTTGKELYDVDADAEAIELYRRALESIERRPDPGREAEARTLLAEALSYAEQPTQAAKEYERAYAIQQSVGADTDTRIQLLQNMGDVLIDADRNEEAFSRLETAVAIARAEYGDPSDELIYALNHISRRYQNEGWHDDARRVLAERLLQLARDGESESTMAAGIHERLGDMAISDGEPSQAVVHYERMVQIQGFVWGEESPDLIPGLSKLSQAYVNAERPADANAINLRLSRIGMVVLRDQLSTASKDFKLFGLPGLVVLLAGFLGLGAVVVVGGVALTRRLARVEPAAPGETRVAFQIVGAQPHPPRQGSFEGQGGEVFGIWIVNMLLTVVTLGVYHFWAKVRMRRYVWAHSGLGDDRFAFHGTPQELFLGWLKGAPLLVFILYGPTIAQLFGVSIFTAQMIALAAFGLALLLWPIAEVGAHRYRLTRSSWRGIRFAFDGSPWRYLGIYLLNWPMWLFTLGLWTPFFNSYKRRFLIGHMSFGNSLFRCDARGRDLFWRYALNWILFLPTLGMYSFWYRAYRERYYWSRTTFRGARFRCTVTGGQLFEIYGVGGLLVLISLGLAWPWVHARRLKVWLEAIHIDGDLELESVRQRAQDDTAVGEGIADFLGLDMGFLA